MEEMVMNNGMEEVVNEAVELVETAQEIEKVTKSARPSKGFVIICTAGVITIVGLGAAMIVKHLKKNTNPKRKFRAVEEPVDDYEEDYDDDGFVDENLDEPEMEENSEESEEKK